MHGMAPRVSILLIAGGEKGHGGLELRKQQVFNMLAPAVAIVGIESHGPQSAGRDHTLKEKFDLLTEYV